MKPGKKVIYRLFGGKMMLVGKTDHPERNNFVICCDYGDWSGFRALNECIAQFSELESANRPNGFYWVEEK